MDHLHVRSPLAMRVVLCIALVLPVMGCSFTPERAVFAEVRRRGQRWADTPVDWNTLQLLQTVRFDDRTIVAVAMTRIEKVGERSDCVFVYEATRRRLAWWAVGGGGGCGPADVADVPGSGAAAPIHIGSGQNHAMRADGWSRVDGLVYDDAIARVEVVWEDGTTQGVSVIRGSILAVREGTHQYQEVRALDAEGQVVYVHEQPEIAPGKQVRWQQ